MELETEDKVISEFVRSIGPWRDHVVIGGGYALIIYHLYLAEAGKRNPPVGTHDLDSLIPRKVPEASVKSIARHLAEAGFQHVFKDHEEPATEAYVKEVAGVEVEIEFLTDNAARKDKEKNVRVAGIVAQPLSYLKLSLQRTLTFETKLKERGRVVSPEAWMFHKGLTFTRRRSGQSKYYKDLYGIWYVSTQLGELSQKAMRDLKSLGANNPRWLKTFQRNLKAWRESASPADWSKLEGQDPLGGLKRASFERLIETFISHTF
jgi:hypothetical protein